ncbi:MULTISPECIES: 3-oxoacyl-ACP reductase [Micrococcaceae]|uniref:3-oxoacyl-ACP reductase n=1 Tax=Glutamicibacter soli TaxID=453836 RepID=A0A6L9G3D7_9MICC|nr:MULTISPECIES: 3-oxoacyl-ACP reductase [Micrococcaceae]ALD63880.1 3-ketoacyl-ACP reductase [Arthrobacter sp. LS16]ALQ30825.1 3-ketoacyl-ACP reductase [Arthrobacter sp. YC-RL1]KLI87899.1 3-ketoacyl-ACP reductase [Arthrobacter sp. YC-RL1]NAZ15778.1 3-oxoacyl-ACP reductase [Glutamicibacter soli]RKS23014.1 3-oxoacyl-[acyl-carrier protein] reductase [Arthrobacter sp. AG1021]
MADKYMELVNTGMTKKLAKLLGLPRPPRLRRYGETTPLLPGPVLVLGSSARAQELSDTLMGWDLDVRRHDAGDAKLGGLVLLLDELTHPEQLSPLMLAAGAALRKLVPGARVVSISRPALDTDAPALAAVRQGIDGAMRSLGREMRGGATANGIVLTEGTDLLSPGTLGALRFFFSGRSAYVDGQFLTVRSTDGELPADFRKPLAGKVAVVTGAARGIGASIARTLARDGAQLVVVDMPAAGEALAAVANQIGATTLQLDVTAKDAAQQIMDHAIGRHGSLDIVVHNAGITRDKLLANMDAARWDSVIAVNIASQLRMNEAFLAAKLPGLRVVSLASTSGIAGNRGQTNYAASKGGVIGMVRSSAKLFAEQGGSIAAVAPGFIETEMTAKIPLGTRTVARMVLPSLMQGGLPQDVAEAISFLSSDAAAGLNGQVLRVCGQSLVGA